MEAVLILYQRNYISSRAEQLLTPRVASRALEYNSATESCSLSSCEPVFHLPFCAVVYLPTPAASIATSPRCFSHPILLKE